MNSALKKGLAILLGLLAVAVGFVWFFGKSADGGIHYITPLAASISEDGTTVRIEVPNAGGCAEDHQFPKYKQTGSVLVIWVEENQNSFHCLVGCLAQDEFFCSEMLVLVLDEPVDPATHIRFQTPGPSSTVVSTIAVMVLVGIGLIGLPRLLRGSGRSRRRVPLDIGPEGAMGDPDVASADPDADLDSDGGAADPK